MCLFILGGFLMSKLNQFKEEIKNRTGDFLAAIASKCREGFDYDKPKKDEDCSGFPIFETADPLFYKSKFQEGYLEWLVRDLLVNELLNYLFVNHGYDIRWKFKDNCRTTGGYRNRENENKFPVEFFLVLNGEYVAYRYTPFTEHYSMTKPYNIRLMYMNTGVEQISKWVSIYWTDKSRDAIIKENNLYKVLEIEEPFQTIITIKGLFEEFFSLEEYELFVEGIKEAVAKANGLMGFQTIPRLVPNNIAIFREEVLEDISNIDFSLMRYKMVNEKGEITSGNHERFICQEDNDIMRNNFDVHSRYFALTGVKKHAQSFITSEYLYRIFKEGTSFDYTAVISGYIKSVEQLSACIVYDILVKKADPALFIKSRHLLSNEISLLKNKGDLKKIGKYYYVSMRKENQQYFDDKLTMGQLFYFFENNKEKVFCIDNDQSESVIFECMQNYFSFDRNGYFHKHNITDFDVVKRIRNNTLMILYWLLGATVLSENCELDFEGLGIVDTSFDRLFKKIAYRNNLCFSVKMKDESERKVIRLFTGKEYSFDSNGYLQGAQLRFYEVDKYPENFIAYRDYIRDIPKSTPILTIDREHLPERIYMISYEGKKEEIKY